MENLTEKLDPEMDLLVAITVSSAVASSIYKLNKGTLQVQVLTQLGFTFKPRLVNFGGAGQPDPALEATLLKGQQNKCPDQTDSNTNSVALDSVTTNRFDNRNYTNLVNNSVLLQSDQALMGDNKTASMVLYYSKYLSSSPGILEHQW